MAAARTRRTKAPSGVATGTSPRKVVRKQIQQMVRPTSQPVQASSTSDAELRQVQAVLEDYKAIDLTVIALAGQASFADYLVIATGTSTRHVASMGRALQDKLGKASFLGLEGLDDGEWVCADLGGIVVHLFLREKRVLYNLEKLWSFAFAPAKDPLTGEPDETDNG